MWQKTLSFGGLLCFLLALTSVTLAAGKVKTIKGNEFLIKKWTTEDGLPQNTITSIVQTRDGYIWLGTFGGLARFDGVKFTVFDSTSSPVLRSNRVTCLYEDEWSRLWFGAENGDIYIFQNGQLSLFSSGGSRRGAVRSIVSDSHYHLFVSSNGGLERYSFDETGAIVPATLTQLSTEPTFRLARHPNGSIWALIQGHVYRIERENLIPDENYPTGKAPNALMMDFADDGSMLVGEWFSLSVAGGGRVQTVMPLDPVVHQGGGYAINAHKGSFWMQLSNELYEFKDSVLAKYDLSGIVHNGSRAMFFDSEENLWLATQGDGLVMLTRRSVGLLTDLVGDQPENYYTLLATQNGEVWLGGLNLLRVFDGKVISFSKRKDGAPFPVVRALAIDHNNKLWVGGSVGLFKLENDQLVAIPGFEHQQLFALLFDSKGDLWVGGTEGLWRYSNGQATHFDSTTGLVNDEVHRIAETRDGTLWVGTLEGISRYREGHWDNLTIENGQSRSYVREILEDKDGTVWLGTYGDGLSRYKDGRLNSITRVSGLPNNFISRVLVGDDERFWILTNLGVFAVARKELNRMADGGSGPLAGSMYGVADGMPSSEANGGNQYAGTKAADGKLWFPMLRDVVIINPNRVSNTPPRVFIESASSLTSDNLNAVQTDIRAGITIANSVRNLQIEYTGLSFSKPRAVRFLYKLDGLDSDWTDAGDRRTAFYPYLPAGNYTFRVKAVNGNGVWSDSVASLSISVAARFWETRTFRVLVALGLVAVVALLYRLRVRQLQAHHERQRDFARRLIGAHETERMRLAKDLHDGLGQHLLLIKNFASLGLSKKSGANYADSYFEKISGAASDSIEETRAIVNELGPQNLRRFGLTEAITNMIQDVEAASGVAFERRIADIDKLLSEESELSVYRVVQECLNNVVKHSKSSRAEIEVDHVGRGIKIAVRDFGSGFSPDEVLSKKNRVGFGFQSIRERVDLLGGKVDITSKLGQGTRVSIEIGIENGQPNDSPDSR